VDFAISILGVLAISIGTMSTKMMNSVRRDIGDREIESKAVL
jgi:hypothetical protein